ncbi:MAG TPA: histidine kinase, partial [Spirochaetia bacterium]
MADRHYFTHAPVALWEEDVSGLRALLAEWRRNGISDLRAHLSGDAVALHEALHAVEIVDVNESAVALYRAESREQLIGPL